MTVPKSKKPLYLAILIAVIFVAFAIIGLARLKARLSTATTMPEPPLAAKTVTVHTDTLKQTLSALATVKSAASVQIKAETSGELISLPLREGDLVKTGDLVAVIDSREQQAQLSAAQAKSEGIDRQILSMKAGLKSLFNQKDALESNFRFILSDLKRDEKLYNADAISARALEISRNKKVDAESRLRSLEAQIQAQQAQIASLQSQKKASSKEIDLWQVRKDYNEIRAEFDGVISARLQEEGNRIMPGMPIMVIDDTSSIRLIMQLPQSMSSHVTTQQKVQVEGHESLDFRISRIHPTLNNFRQITVEAVCQNLSEETEKLKFDMQIPVKIIIKEISGTKVPAAARFINFNHPRQSIVYILEESRATRTSLKPLLIDEKGDAVFAETDLAPGTILAQGTYLENVRLPATFSVEVIK